MARKGLGSRPICPPGRSVLFTPGLQKCSFTPGCKKNSFICGGGRERQAAGGGEGGAEDEPPRVEHLPDEEGVQDHVPTVSKQMVKNQRAESKRRYDKMGARRTTPRARGRAGARGRAK